MTVGEVVAQRRNIDPRGVWTAPEPACKPLDTGRFAGKPLSGLRVATIVANFRLGA